MTGEEDERQSPSRRRVGGMHQRVRFAFTLLSLLLTNIVLGSALGCDALSSSAEVKDDDDNKKKSKKKKKKKKAVKDDADDDAEEDADDDAEEDADDDAEEDADDDNGEGSSSSKGSGEDLGVEKQVSGRAVGPVTRPEQQSYPLDAINPVANNCQSPFVIMATAPQSVGSDYGWTWTRQTMLANQQYKVVTREPTAPGEVTFDLHQASEGFQNSWVLVARCEDGSTCNHLAAMYKAVVKTSRPQVGCGNLPMGLSAATRRKPSIRMGGDAKNSLPETSDVIGLCARLNACMIADDPAMTGNPGLDCQKSPSSFKTACARNYPCAEVMACLDR